MPTFFARRYMRPPEAVSGTEKTVGIVILVLVAAVVAKFVYQVATDRDYLFNVSEQAHTGAPTAEVASGPDAEPTPPAEVPNPFPDVGLDGWKTPRQVEHFNADNLYIKIDGRAEAYLKFNVVGLTFGRYCHVDDAQRTVDVYWYDMGTPTGALGMFRSEQPADTTPVSIGQTGYQVGGAVFFCQDSSYVQVMPSGLSDADAQVALSIARRLASQIERS